MDRDAGTRHVSALRVKLGLGGTDGGVDSGPILAGVTIGQHRRRPLPSRTAAAWVRAECLSERLRDRPAIASPFARIGGRMVIGSRPAKFRSLPCRCCPPLRCRALACARDGPWRGSLGSRRPSASRVSSVSGSVTTTGSWPRGERCGMSPFAGDRRAQLDASRHHTGRLRVRIGRRFGGSRRTFPGSRSGAPPSAASASFTLPASWLPRLSSGPPCKGTRNGEQDERCNETVDFECGHSLSPPRLQRAHPWMPAPRATQHAPNIHQYGDFGTAVP